MRCAVPPPSLSIYGFSQATASSQYASPPIPNTAPMVLEAAVTPGRCPFRHHTFYCSRHCKHLYVFILFSYSFTNSVFGCNVIAMYVYASILHSTCVIVLIMVGISCWSSFSSVLTCPTSSLDAKSWVHWSGNVMVQAPVWQPMGTLFHIHLCYQIQWRHCLHIYIDAWFLTYLLTCTHMHPWSAPIV